MLNTTAWMWTCIAAGIFLFLTYCFALGIWRGRNQVAAGKTWARTKGEIIASEVAAQLYGLKVIKSRIEDNLNNFTRFLVLSQKPPQRTGKDKTSLMLSIKDKVGALYDLLRPFASHGLSMTKIESRPSRRKAWEYIFFVDVEGHIEEERVKRAVEEITSRCLFMKVLGSYPAHS